MSMSGRTTMSVCGEKVINTGLLLSFCAVSSSWCISRWCPLWTPSKLPMVIAMGWFAAIVVVYSIVYVEVLPLPPLWAPVFNFLWHILPQLSRGCNSFSSSEDFFGLPEVLFGAPFCDSQEVVVGVVGASEGRGCWCGRRKVV